MSQDPAGDPAVPRPAPARTPPPPPLFGIDRPAAPQGWAAPAHAPVGTSAPSPWVSPGGPTAVGPEPRIGPVVTPPGSGAGPWISPGGGAGPAGPGPGSRATTGIEAERTGGPPLRPLGVGDILDGTFTTIRRNPKATLGLAAILVTIQQLLVVGLTLLTEGLPAGADLDSDDISVGPLFTQLLGGYGGLSGMLLSAVVGAVLTGMLVVVVSEDVLGRRVTVGEVWARVRPRIWALLVAATIAGIVPYIALVPVALPGMILWSAWAVTTPAVVLERLGPFQALRRSWRLVWPAIALVWLIRALSVLIGWLIDLIVALPFGVVAGLLSGTDREDEIALVAAAVRGIAADTITMPFLAGVLALIYLDRRIRGEGLDLVLRRQRRLTGVAPTQLPAVPTLPGVPR